MKESRPWIVSIMQSMLKAWEAELVGLHGRLGGLFQRSEPRQRSLAYLKGLLGSVEQQERLAAGRVDGRGHA